MLTAGMMVPHYTVTSESAFERHLAAAAAAARESMELATVLHEGKELWLSLSFCGLCLSGPHDIFFLDAAYTS
jgi:hypothetical protein